MSSVLIIGGNGMAGHMIGHYLERLGWDVSYTTRQHTDKRKNVYFFDATDCTKLDNILNNCSPNFVINAVGVLNQVAQEKKSMAITVNSLFPHILNEKSNDYKYKLIHISTDCVFSGSKGGYKEDDIPDAVSFYGRTKALGEINNMHNVTIRTSIIGPEIRDTRIGLLNWFINQNGDIKGFTNAIWTGVTTLQLAKSIVDIINMDICGLIHLVNNQKISKYELLLLLKKYYEVEVNIEPSNDYFCDKSLINTRSDYNLHIPDYNTMIKELIEWKEIK